MHGMTTSLYQPPKHVVVQLDQIRPHPDIDWSEGERIPPVALTPSLLAAFASSPMVAQQGKDGAYLLVSNRYVYELLKLQPDSGRLRVALVLVPPDWVPVEAWSLVELHLVPYLRGRQKNRESRVSRKALRHGGIQPREQERRSRLPRTPKKSA